MFWPSFRHHSMLVKGGVIEMMSIEPDSMGDPFEVSDVDNMLSHITSNGPKPLDVTVFTRERCP